MVFWLSRSGFHITSEDEERAERPRRGTPKSESKGLKIQVPTFQDKSDLEAYLE